MLYSVYLRCILMISSVDVTHCSVRVLSQARPRLESDSAFKAITLEADRVRLFKEHIAALEESRRQHSSSKRHAARKNKKQRRRSESASPRSHSQVSRSYISC